jgi:hypothetical protein
LAVCALAANAENVLGGGVQINYQQVIVEENNSRTKVIE